MTFMLIIISVVSFVAILGMALYFNAQWSSESVIDERQERLKEMLVSGISGTCHAKCWVTLRRVSSPTLVDH